MATHTVQCPPQEMCNEANGFLQEIVPIVNDGNRSPASTLNMDQTPINHVMNPKDTIDRRGMHTINLRTAGRDSDRHCHDHGIWSSATLACCVQGSVNTFRHCEYCY
jgi:hypothetical protein